MNNRSSIGMIGYFYMVFKRVRSPVEVRLSHQYNVGEKPTVILYTFINRHAEQKTL